MRRAVIMNQRNTREDIKKEEDCLDEWKLQELLHLNRVRSFIISVYLLLRGGSRTVSKYTEKSD